MGRISKSFCLSAAAIPGGQPLSKILSGCVFFRLSIILPKLSVSGISARLIHGSLFVLKKQVFLLKLPVPERVQLKGKSNKIASDFFNRY